MTFACHPDTDDVLRRASNPSLAPRNRRDHSRPQPSKSYKSLQPPGCAIDGLDYPEWRVSHTLHAEAPVLPIGAAPSMTSPVPFPFVLISISVSGPDPTCNLCSQSRRFNVIWAGLESSKPIITESLGSDLVDGAALSNAMKIQISKIKIITTPAIL